MEKPHFPVPANEQKRLEVLRSYQILDTAPEKQFDDLALLASIICDSPITLISLVDGNRLWFKSKVGALSGEQPREISVCQYAILGDDIFEVENSLEDERFSQNPLVTGPPSIRFYAGAPLKTSSGYNLGTLCVFDTKPRKLTEHQKTALGILANEVVANMELRKERNFMEREKRLAIDSNELLNAFLENSPSIITMKDLEGRYIYANRHAQQIFGKKHAEILGKKGSELFSIEAAAKLERDDQQVILEKRNHVNEYESNEHGNVQHFIRRVFPLINTNGNVTGIGTISNEITDFRMMANDLKLSNDRFTSLFYNSPIAMLIADMETGELLEVNHAFLKTFGYSLDEVVGKKQEDLNFIVDQEHALALGKELMEKGYAREWEFKLRRKNGEEFFVLSSVDVIQTEGRIQAISAFQDISERKKVEVKLQEAKKEAETATLSKSLFLANMSHEIRTPLNAMLGFTELLNRSSLNGQQKEYLNIIETSGRNLLAIINDILDFSKIEAGMMTIERVPFSPQQILHSVFTMFYAKAQEKNLKMITSIDPQTPSLVCGDPTRLNQIMVNLIGNAIKFTSEGNITIDCSVMMRTLEKCTIKISVKDTGIGISRDKMNTIFDRFTQAEASTTRTFGGTGLGLSIAKRLLELQDGEINVISEPGKGSEFYFMLDYDISSSNAYAHTESALPKAQNTFEGKRILLVEDNLMNQKLAMAFLQGEGLEIELAENGQVALDLLQQKTFDLVLMDIQMPILDGYEATKKIRAELKMSIPIIAMTANAMNGEHERCISLGMDDYITKPFQSESLLRKMGRFLTPHAEADVNRATKSPVVPNSVTNLSYLHAFAGNNKTFVAEMIGVFLNQNPTDLKNLEIAVKHADYAAIKTVSHALKTSLSFIGFPPHALTELQLMESLASKKDQLHIIEEKSKMLIRLCNQAHEELKELGIGS